MDITGLIKTDFINPASDAFWEQPAIHAAEKKDVLILTASYTPGSGEQAQLQKMIDACKLSPAQYNLLQLGTTETMAWHKLKEALQPRIVFLVGVFPQQLGVSAMFRLNEPNRFDERTWLPTLAVSELEQHADVKKQLWLNGMKPIFVDNYAKYTAA